MNAPASLSAALAPCEHDSEPVDLVNVADELSNDQTLVVAIGMAVTGLGEEHDCTVDANAVAELVRTLKARLEHRSRQLDELRAADRKGRRPIAV